LHMRCVPLRLEPIHDLAPVGETSDRWEATGSDPQIRLLWSDNITLKRGHYYFEVRTSEGFDQPVLYVDYGSGISEHTSIALEFHKISDGLFRAYIMFPKPASALRFDPICGFGSIQISDVALLKKSRLRWYAELARLAHTSQTVPDLRRNIRASVNIAKRQGWLGLAARLRSRASRVGYVVQVNEASENIDSGHHTSNIYADNYLDMSAIAEGYRSPHFAPDRVGYVDRSQCPLKVVAYYLPQFHQFPENDKWWGTGFTEWTNVTKAVPRFVGHYQPRLPTDLGFYDLRLVDVMARQADLARKFGISAFCFHFYWFGGTRLMETPLQQFLAKKDIDIEFCLCWANENWTRRWDGAEHEVLIGQKHSSEDDQAFLEHVATYFKDPRYLKVDGKPILIVYRASILPDASATTARWRELAVKLGFPGLYLVATTSFGFREYKQLGFDALVEFPPHATNANEISGDVTILDPRFNGKVFDYESILQSLPDDVHDPDVTIHPCVVPSWDNTARRPLSSHVFAGSTPLLYRRWLDKAFRRAIRNKKHERFVFINAWNEWAEGAYLEPDRIYGHAYLWATASVIEGHSQTLDLTKGVVEKHNADWRPRSRIAVVAHIFYTDVAEELSAAISSAIEIDIYITVPKAISVADLDRVCAAFPRSFIMKTSNVGRDILPFLTMMKHGVGRHKYDWVCKLHSKKSSHLGNGLNWRKQLYAGLAGPLNEGTRAFEHRSNGRIGLIGAAGSVAELSDYIVRKNTEELIQKYCKQLNIKVDWDLEKFVAGSMFWFRPEALGPLLDADISEDDFGVEMGRIDGTLAHAVERLIGIVARHQGYGIAELDSTDVMEKYYKTSSENSE
jgi:lipopolysaccharide biosynthesis protein